MPGRKQDISRYPTVTEERLRSLYANMLRLDTAEAGLRALFKKRGWPLKHLPAVEHPAVLAGCFSQLEAGDIVTPDRYVFAANLAAGVSPGSALRQLAEQVSHKRERVRRHLSDAEVAAWISGAAQARQIEAKRGVVVAMMEDAALRGKSVAAVFRRGHALHLPLVLVSITHALPNPGDDMRTLGMPRITVAGDDAAAIYRVVQESMHRARTGIGPTWVQCALEHHRDNPLAAMRKYLASRGMKADTPKSWQNEWKSAVKLARNEENGPRESVAIAGFGAS